VLRRQRVAERETESRKEETPVRWTFADPDCPEERAYRERTLAAIDRWWRSFQAKTSDLDALFHRRSEWDLVAWMHDTLGEVHPQLMWEYGSAVRQSGHRLVLTPEGAHWLRPVVRTLLQRAPHVPGWEFYAHRLPEDVPMTIQTVEARVSVNITGALVAASVAPGRKVDLWFRFPLQPQLDERTAANAAFVATEALLGEQVLDTWIGGISLLEEGPKNLRPLPLDRAQATVGAVIGSIGEQLPAGRSQDISDEADNWSSLQLNPGEPADDFAGRDDLLFATTADIERFRAAHCGRLFASACHTRCGELFCYLKLDGQDVPRRQVVEFRSRFEEALNPVLVQAGAGCCVGGGSGLRYAYIDLALTDVQQAIPLIRQVLTTGRAPLRSWLLFMDSELAHEWVGAYPQTPPPPLPAED